jgi:hypothetical protein
MATRLPPASGYETRVRRDLFPRAPRQDRGASPGGANGEWSLFAPESRPVLRIAAIISAFALMAFGIVAVALFALLSTP